jgi:hypothetical protein
LDKKYKNTLYPFKAALHLLQHSFEHPQNQQINNILYCDYIIFKACGKAFPQAYNLWLAHTVIVHGSQTREQ